MVHPNQLQLNFEYMPRIAPLKPSDYRNIKDTPEQIKALVKGA